MKRLNTDNKLIILIVLFGLMVYIPYILSFNEQGSGRKYYTGDSWWYMEIARSIVRDGDLDMSNNIPTRFHLDQYQLSLSKDRYLAPKHGIFFPIATLPFYLIFNDAGFPIFNLVFTLLILVFLYRIIRSFFEANISFITTLIYGLASIIFPYSYNYLSDVFALAIILAGIDLSLRAKYYSAVFFLALSIFAKITNLLWITPILVYIAYQIYQKNQGDFKKTIIQYAQLALLFFLGILPLLITNYTIYGDIFTTGYQRIATYTMDGGIALESHTHDFNRPFTEGLKLLLFNATRGILWDNYVLIPASIGLLLIWKIKQRPALISFLFIILMQTVFYSKYKLSLATEFGNRFLFLSIVLSAIFFANILDIIYKAWKNKYSIKSSALNS